MTDIEAAPFRDRDGDEIEGTRINADGTVTLFLDKKVRVMSEEVAELKFRRFTPQDLIKLDRVKGANAQNIELLRLLANVPSSAIENLDAADFTAAVRVSSGFTTKSRTVGEG